MSGRHELDQLKERGAGVPASDAVVQLYKNAFHEFGSRFLWSRRASEHPTFAQALTIADCLRREGNLRSRAFAAHIEEACRAALQTAK